MSGWQDHPYQIPVKAGETKHFCHCGNSKNPPYCDGSHKGTGITPFVVAAEEDKTLYICGCLKSSNRPFCDGCHKQ